MCDTFVALPSVTVDGSVVFGKNSDREPNEAQTLEYHPARAYSTPAALQCTYRAIPQVKATLGILISRPFWMWGAEMGANEKGVVIGNEAVWTRMPLSKKNGLTGMDLLRLALERSATASAALETIVGLLADHGQGGICGYEDKRLAYHNSFIIADPGQAWVLETAGHLWAALKIMDFYAISNGLTIGEAFDESHPQLIETARVKGWLKKGQSFHFARCFSDWFYTTFSACRSRQRRSADLIGAERGRMNPAAAMKILRDHQGAEYRPDSHFLGNRICAHAANRLARSATQTTGSLVAHLKPEIQSYWATGTAAPCTSLFKPVWFNANVLPDIGPPPGGTYNAASLWWQHEQLHRSILPDFATHLQALSLERDQIEKAWMEEAAGISAPRQWDLTQAAFRQARQKTSEWIKQSRSASAHRQNQWTYRRYWQTLNRKAGIKL
jgi:secernin